MYKSWYKIQGTKPKHTSYNEYFILDKAEKENISFPKPEVPNSYTDIQINFFECKVN